MTITTLHFRKILVAWFGIFAASLVVVFPVLAAPDYPTRPIRFLVGFAPGGATDLAARVIGAEMAKNLGQSVVIENRPGASAHIATQALLAAPADGYTIMLATLTLATNPALMENVGYNPEKDLTMVSQVTAMPVVVYTRGDSPLNDMKDLINAAKTKNGALKFGSGGIGTSPHLGPELLSRVTGFKYTHIPYRGGTPALQALFSGEIDAMYDTAVTPLHKSNLVSGKIKALGVMQKERLASLPDVKTAAEQGVPDEALFRSWQGVSVRSGTPLEIVGKLHASIVSALQSKEVVDKLMIAGVEVAPSAKPVDFQKLYMEELTRWTSLIKEAGIKAEQ